MPSFPLHMIQIDINAVAPLFVEKLRCYAKLFEAMEQNGGWLRYPEYVLSYFRELEIAHWAELYWKDGQARWNKSHEAEIVSATQFLLDSLGPELSLENVNSFLNEFSTDLSEAAIKDDDASLLGMDFRNIKDVDVDLLSEDERREQRDLWIVYHLNFYNDLSLATHGEMLCAFMICGTPGRHGIGRREHPAMN